MLAVHGLLDQPGMEVAGVKRDEANGGVSGMANFFRRSSSWRSVGKIRARQFFNTSRHDSLLNRRVSEGFAGRDLWAIEMCW
ncbi:MAG: hypothetical protein MUF81_06555, partial [Verrucomicrobia bacterium]|nr:hypothetical protein [Verrucomicrobiota bacterium]